MKCCLESILQVLWLANPNRGVLYLQEAPGDAMDLVAHHNTAAVVARGACFQPLLL